MAGPPPERALLTDDQIAAWRSLVEAHARISVLIEADLVAEHRLPLVEYEVLVQLLDAPDQRLRMTELAERVLLSRSGLTRLVDRMEREGLVLRALCTEDGRGTYAVLTPSGTQRLRAASGTYFRGLRTHLVDALPATDIASMSRTLGRLADALSVNGPASSSVADAG
jgi:DNA-binding MarR family transcriptional regulator